MEDTLWEDIRTQLKHVLPSHVYHSYVERARGEAKKSGLRLEFSDSFAKENFEQKCLPIVKEILKKQRLTKLPISMLVTGAGSAPEQTEISPYALGQLYESSPFDAKYTFDTFVVGSSNQFAHAACLAVAKQPGQAYNPLFLFGGAGLGKTHLLRAIGYEVSLMDKNLKVIFLSCEAFTNELIQAIRLDRMREFREKYRRGCDVLLLDDIHFLAGKERTQEEFFYTFNSLHELRKQIIVTSDRYPKDIPGLEKRLQTRFEWGLVADLQPPEIETRVAILKNKAELEGIPLPDEVAEFIATHVKNNIRELEGALHRLQAYATLMGVPINVELASQTMKDIAPKHKHELTPEAILKLVSIHFNVKTTDLKSDKRVRKLTFPRQICMYLLRKYLLMSFPEIGRFMGGKDHTTILHGVSKISDLARSDAETLNHITEIESLIR
ncbi:MAG: chromosomal replication initiator protein DnaA [Bdellovibrionales bacterium]|nr:chromosomal replication initiator protein DnaA [Bdellovibrionales bacterium]